MVPPSRGKIDIGNAASSAIRIPETKFQNDASLNDRSKNPAD